MAAVPQNVLNWMYNVLKGEYNNPDRTYSDVAQVLSQHRSLSVRTDVYTYRDGRSSLLLNVSGTLPTLFRGREYRFPISLWVPHEYPRDAPMGFAKPTENMAVRVGQYVDVEGMIYHPYLAGWREDRSNLLQLVSIMQEIFAKEPPLIAKQEQPPQHLPRQIINSVPPPVPPLPPEIQKTGADPLEDPRPPPPPPKPRESHSKPEAPLGEGPPPIPPRPHENNNGEGNSETERPLSLYGRPPPPTPRELPQRNSSLRHSFSPEPLDYQGSPAMQRNTRNDFQGPNRSYSGYQERSQPNLPQRFQSQQPHEGPPPLPNGYPPTSSTQREKDRQLPHSNFQQPSTGQYYQSHSYPQQAHDMNQRYPPYPQKHMPSTNPQPKKAPPTDLLTSPFDNSLPPPTPQFTAPAPPIPPNPQKDALFSNLSTSLTSLATQMHSSNTAALPALDAQRAALSATLANINDEIASLESLSTLLTNNEKVLHSSMTSADSVLADAKNRSVPDIDEVLVAPTRVEGQLYEVVCEERAIRETRVFLARCLDRGRLGGEVWARQTRALAREEFGKMWLERKIARGLGLSLEGRPGTAVEGNERQGGEGEGWYR